MARGVSPADSLSFKWTDPKGQPVNDFVQYPAVGRDGDNTKISHLRVKKSVWDPNNSYKCSVGEKKIDVVPAANRVTKPSITLLSRADGDKILIECQVNNYYPDKLTVQWLRNDQPISTSLPNKKLQNGDGKEKTFTLISQLAISVRDQGTLYTCKATHNSEEITQNYNVCTDLAKPSIHLKKPHLRDIMKGGGVTTTCVVEAPYNTEVSWLVNGASKQATRQSKTDLSNSRTQIVSNLTLTKEDWLSLRTLVCKGKHPCVQEEKAAIEAENILKNPVVVIRRPFRKSESAVLECVVRDLPSIEVCITLQANGADISEINCVDVTRSENIQSLTTDFTIPKEHHKKDKTFTCTVRSLSKSWTSKPTGNIFDDPTVALSVVPSVSGSSSNPEKLVCSGTGFNPKITWLPNYEAKTGPVVTIGEDGRVKVYSEILVSQQEWNQGITFTCKITDQLFSKTVYKNINICSAHTFSEPLILVKKPHLRDIMKGGGVTTTCVVEAPYKTEVSWLVNGASKQATRQNQIDLSSSRIQIVSNLTLTKEDWLSLRTLVCKGKHPCVQEEKAAIEAENILKNPVVVIRRPFRKSESAVLECVVRDLPSIEVCITLQANGADISEINCVDVTRSENIQSLTTDFTIPKEHHKKDKTFTCTVRSLSKSWTSNPTGNIFDDPTVALSVVPSVSGSSSNPEKLVCSGTGFNPKITWLPKFEEKTGPVVTVGENGRVKVYSEILVSQQEWTQGVTFTCKITDQLIAKTIHKNISICAVNECSSQLADVYLLGPSLSDVRSGTDVILTCLVIGHRVKDFTVQWKTDGRNSNSHHYIQHPQDHANGTQSVQSILKVPVSTWHAYSVFTCEVKHFCSGDTQKKHISKTRDPKRPTVRIFKPSDSDLSGSQNISLLCMITGFFPSEISVHWQLNKVQLDASRYTNSPVVSHIGAEGYSIYSTLILPASQWKEEIYSCIVSHESSQNPIMDTLENLYASLTHSAPTARLLQGSNELVCLAFGFSPSAINITWLLGLTELSHQKVTSPAEGPDGKFSIRSHLHLLPTEWAPGEVYSCSVTHITGILLLNISKPEIFEEAIFMNENKAESIAHESLEEAWKMACSFLVLFLLSLFYGCTVTLVKVKTT
ncbi:uncharacterized protein ighd isoform X2 [Triplophysa rosa]|nr:uncharacterized protein ighd isoform X2 [Triplophysa rosa]XP_057200922.1 uncharacterized protein ighd isoform X2 [Triplophysa rosa]XP_057200923.1 uncharacterized protein ighd isoform X2 [Triplophysa rosa]